MKNSTAILLAGAIASVIIGIVIMKFIGVLTWYSMPSSSMTPNIPTNKSLLFVSSLKRPAINDLICYTIAFGEKKENTLKRLVARNGDKLQIINDLAYVNGKLIDDSMKLNFAYSVCSHKDQQGIKVLIPKENIVELSSDSFLIFTNIVTAKQLSAYGRVTRIYLDHQTEGFDLFMSKEDPDWTISNYGPITIPKGFCFALGDNRENALDSRYKGFINEKEVHGSVIWQINW